MVQLILSEENFQTGLKFKFINSPLFQHNEWITDGIIYIDSNKIQIMKEEPLMSLDTKFLSVVSKYINKNNLNLILNTRYNVEFSDISYLNWTLASTKETDTLINHYYVDWFRELEVFYKDNIFYLFYLLEADEDIGVDFDSYMFIGILAGVNSTDKTVQRIKLLEQYNKNIKVN